MKAIEKLIATAEAELGYLEKKSNKNLDDKGNLSRAWKCKGRAEGLCTAPIWKEDDLVDRIGDALSINCNAAGMAEVGSLLIGDRIEQTA